MQVDFIVVSHGEAGAGIRPASWNVSVSISDFKFTPEDKEDLGDRLKSFLCADAVYEKEAYQKMLQEQEDGQARLFEEEGD